MNKTILLVEDNPDDEALALRALRRNNVAASVCVARDGLEALDLLNLSEDSCGNTAIPLPSVILLDVKLPKIGGIEVLRRIRADGRTAHLPVVVLTSSLEPSDISAAYESHASSYIRKPVDFTEFIDIVYQISRYWLDLNHLPEVD